MTITIKGKNNKLVFHMDDQIDYQHLMDELEVLLEKPHFSKDGFFPRALFDFHQRKVNEENLSKLFTILFSKQVIIFDGLIEPQEEKTQLKQMKVIEGDMRAGQQIECFEETLIVGNINQGAQVTAYENIYVLGQVSGFIQINNEQVQISAQSYKSAHIRFLNQSRHQFTNFEPTILYYKDNQIMSNKGEI